jgi:hypothetical protein
MHPKDRAQMMAYMLRSGIKDKVKFASDVAKPVDKFEVQQIKLFNEFNRRNPRTKKAGGGRIGFNFGGSETALKQAAEKKQTLKNFVTKFKKEKGETPRLIDIKRATRIDDKATKKYLTEGEDYKITVKPGINAPKTGKKKYVKMTPEERAEAYRLRDEGGAANTLARNKKAKEIIDSFIEKEDYENFKTQLYESQKKFKLPSGRVRQTSSGGRVPPTILNFIRERLDAAPGTELFEELKEISGRTEQELIDFKNKIPEKGFISTKQRKKTGEQFGGIKRTEEEKKETQRKIKRTRKEREDIGKKYATEAEEKRIRQIKAEILNKNRLFMNNPDLINSPQYAKIKEMMEVRIAPNDLTLPSGKRVMAGEIYRTELASKGNPLNDEYYRNKAKSGRLFSFFDINKVGTRMGRFTTNVNITPSDFNTAFIEGQVEKFFKDYDPQTKKPGKFYGDTEKLKKVDEYLKSVGVKYKITGMKNRIGGGDPVHFNQNTGDFPHIRNTLNTMGFKDEDINLKPTTNVIPKKTGQEGFIDRQFLTDAGKFLGRTAQGAFLTPTGVAATTLGLGGLDLTSPAGRLSLGAELAFAPELVKASIGATRGMKNRALQKGIQQALNLGLPTRLALRAARLASPVGIATLAGEGLYQAGKFSRDRIRELRAMSPEQRQELRSRGARQAFDPFSAAGGGLAKQAGDRSGAMLESMNPDKDGLPGLLKRVKKL